MARASITPVMAVDSLEGSAAALPDPLQGVRGFAVLVDAQELLGGDEMMRAYAQAMSESELVTLVIDASRLPAQDAESKLVALVDRCELADRYDIDLIALVGERSAAERHHLQSAVHAFYRREDDQRTEPPVFTPESLGQLRAFAQTAALLGPDEARRLLRSVRTAGP